jgi:hypothetical protein
MYKSYAERNSICFLNYLDNVLVWNYGMGWFRRGIEMASIGFIPACFHVLNSLKFRLLPEICPGE